MKLSHGGAGRRILTSECAKFEFYHMKTIALSKKKGFQKSNTNVDSKPWQMKDNYNLEKAEPTQ